MNGMNTFLSTNQLLAGVTWVVVVANFIAITWLWRNVRSQLRFMHDTTGKSAWATLVRRDSIRISVGFIVKALSVTMIFLGRMPLRAMREAGNVRLGDWWLEKSLMWELPAMIGLLLGLALIMWPAFNKIPSKRIALLMFMAGAVVTYAGGVLFCAWLSTAFVNVPVPAPTP